MTHEGNGVETPNEDTQNQEGTGNDWTLDSALSEIKKLREEAKTNRVKRQEVESQIESYKTKADELASKVTDFEAQAAKFADYDELKTGLEKTKQENKNLSLKLSLAGKVIDTDKALRLIEDEDLDEGQLNVERFLEKNPFLALKGQVTNPASNKGNPKHPSSTEDLSKLSEEDLVKYFTNYKPQ